MEVKLDITPVTITQAVDGMRPHFFRPFGRGWVGRRLASAAWSAYRAALLHDNGIAIAESHALTAAEERNARTMLVARWTPRQLARAVRAGVQSAANAA